MKRRNFLAASAILSLFASASASAQATKKKPARTAAKTTGKPKRKSQSSQLVSKSRARRKVISVDNANREAATDATPNVPQPEARTASPSELRNVVKLPQEQPANWHIFELHSNISLKQGSGARLWLPLAQYKDTAWQRTIGHTWQGNFGRAGIYREPLAGMEIFMAEWPESVDTPQLQFISQIATQDRQFDVTRRGVIAEQAEILRYNLRATRLVPTDGIVHRTATRAIGRIKDPLAMGKAIYDWVIENTQFDPNAQGLGEANVGTLLADSNPTGRSADIALLFVALCRSVGIPARPAYGLRVAKSRLFDSLGALGELDQAQYCRAEFYIPGYSWIGVDPAGVRKAIQEERLSNSDPKVTSLKKLLFGFWEMNWIGFNTGQDVTLHGSGSGSLPNLGYPVAETASGRFDSRDTSRMVYQASANRIDMR